MERETTQKRKEKNMKRISVEQERKERKEPRGKEK